MAALFVDDLVVSEADGFVDVVVRLTEPSNLAVSVNYTTSNGTAIANSSADFVAASGTLNFAAGETEKTVRLTISNNTTIENFEHFVFSLSAPTNATLADAAALISIVDNDTAAVTPGLFVRDVTVDEKDGTASFVVMLGGPTGQASGSTVTVDYATANLGATAGADYTARNGTLSFAPGETVKTVVVTIADDAALEGIERFVLNLSNSLNAAIADGTGIAVIGPSDAATVAAPTLSVADAIVSEADGYVDVVVSLSAPGTQAVSVNYTSSNATAIGNSFADVIGVSGTLNFALGETLKTVRVPISDDAVAERFEHFVFSLSTPTNATLADAVALVSIVDNDTVAVTPSLYVRDAMVDEKAGTASFVVMLGGPTGQTSVNTVTVDYTSAGINATSGADFGEFGGTLSFAPGETVKTVVVDIVDDANAEGVERFVLDLNNAVNATIVDGRGVGVIGASDAATVAAPTLSVADAVVSEADGYVDVVVRLSAPGTQAVSVIYETSNGTAIGNSFADVIGVSGTLVFAVGETQKTVRVPLSDDAGAERFEHFVFNLRTPTNATIADAAALISIVDNDTAAVTPGLFVRDVTVDEEAGTASFVVLLGGPTGQGSVNTVTVDYSTANAGATAGSDYTAVSGTLSFGPGETARTVVVDITDDAVREGIERFTLTLGNAVNAAIIHGTGVAVIGASDAAAVAAPTVSVADAVVSEADGYVDVVVSLSAPGTQAVSVNYSTSNGTAIGNSFADVIGVSGTLVFALGETLKTVRVPVSDDAGAERFEHFVFNLSAPVNATIADAAALVSIVDNDTDAVLPDLFVGDVTIDEKAGTASFVVMLGGPTGQASVNTVTVDYATANASATAGADYTATSGTLVFAPGETAKTVVVDILDDATAEAEERFNLVLSNAGNATLIDPNASAVIGASDATAVAAPSISVLDWMVSEADGFVDVMVSLSAPGTQAVSVNYATANGTAIGNSFADVIGVSGTLHFAPGETLKTVRVAVTNDATAENMEQFTFNLSAATNATIADNSATVFIFDNDTPGVEVLSYGISDDEYTIDTDTDRIIENPGGGTDTVYSAVSYTLPDNLDDLVLTGEAAIDGTGNGLDNQLTGNSAANRLRGLEGNDTLDGGGGANTLEGGAGDDSYVIDDNTDALVEDVDAGYDTVRTSVNHTLAANFEELALTGTAPLRAIGNDLDNRISGNAGANVIDGGAGIDTMAGGLGDDVYRVDDAEDEVLEEADAPALIAARVPGLPGPEAGAGSNIDTVIAQVSYTLRANVENLQVASGAGNLGGTGNGQDNVLTGNQGGNALSGLAGRDIINGEAGDDTLDGGAGADTLGGGTGDDTYRVDGADRLVENPDEGFDTVYASVAWTLGAHFEQLVLEGASNAPANGNSGANALTGNTGNNRLNGLSGNDTLSGGTGNDTLDGGTGADRLTGGSGNDTYVVSGADVLVEVASGGTDTVTSATGWTLAGNIERLMLTGTASVNGTGNTLGNVVNGNKAANLLRGLGGADTLGGGEGDDTLAGGDGNDRLSGDAGADVFQFDSALSSSKNVDVVIGFTSGIDTLRLDNDVFKALIPGSGLTEAQFAQGAGLASAQDLDDRLIHDTATGFLYYDADGNLDGGVTAVRFAQLGTTGDFATLAFSDFRIVD